MKKIVKKITTEEFKDGELIKRVTEEITEETQESKFEPITLPRVGDSTSPWEKRPDRWFDSPNTNSNIALLSENK